MANIQFSNRNRDITKRKEKAILPGILVLKRFKPSAECAYNAEEATKMDCFCNVSLPDIITPSLLKLKAPWMQKTFKILSHAMGKASLFHEREIESGFTLQEKKKKRKKKSSSNVVEDKLEASLPPLERHILSSISNKPRFKSQETCFGLDSEILQCKCLEIGLWFGIFLITSPNEKGNLVSTLMDAIQAKPMVYNSSAYARLHGEPGIICTNNSFKNEMMVDLGIKKFEDSNQIEKTPLALMHRMSLKAYGELIPHVVRSQKQQDFPDKEMLNSVQDFFMYTEHEGRRAFEKLDLDADGKVTLSDLKIAMSKMNLPNCYAQKLMQSNGRIWPIKSFGWSEFSSVLQKKEPIMVNLFNSLSVSKSGTLHRENLRESLKKTGLVATEANITSMMKFLGADANGSIKYGQFREFMMLIPTDELNVNPWNVWLRASTADEINTLVDVGFQTSVFNYVATISKALPYSPMHQRFGLKEAK